MTRSHYARICVVGTDPTNLWFIQLRICCLEKSALHW